MTTQAPSLVSQLQHARDREAIARRALSRARWEGSDDTEALAEWTYRAGIKQSVLDALMNRAAG